jgi:hypothetical protein
MQHLVFQRLDFLGQLLGHLEGVGLLAAYFSALVFS